MEGSIVVVLALIAATGAQYYPAIPCLKDETCRDVLDPSTDSKCVQNVCVCANSRGVYQHCSTTNIMITSKHRVGLKKECQTDEDCSLVPGAKCYNETEPRRSVCSCQQNMIPSGDGEKCLEIAKGLAARCSEDVQCATALTGAECFEGRCRCRRNFHFATTKQRCVLNKDLGDNCSRDEESCFQPDLSGENALGCSDNNVCKCKKNYTPVKGSCQYSAASIGKLHISMIFIMVALVMQFF